LCCFNVQQPIFKLNFEVDKDKHKFFNAKILFKAGRLFFYQVTNQTAFSVITCPLVNFNLPISFAALITYERARLDLGGGEQQWAREGAA
jgi:hypothetical protein